MKISTNAMREAFEFASRAAARSTTIDVLRSVRFVAEDKRFTLAGNNLAMFAEASGECGAGSMSFCAKAERIGHALDTAGDEIDLKLEKGSVIWKSGKSRYTIGVIPVADFPAPTSTGQPLDALPGEDIVEQLARVSFACATRDVRLYTLGVCLEVRDGELSATATDGHRLATSTIRSGLAKAFSVIIPRETVGALPPAASEVIVFERRVEFVYPAGRVIAQVVDAAMPDWRRILEVKGSETIKVPRRALLGAIKASLPFDQIGAVRLLMQDGVLQIEGKDHTDQAEQTIEASGSDVDVWFLSTVIAAPLQAISGDDVDLEFALDSGGRKTGTVLIKEGGLRYVGAPFSR